MEVRACSSTGCMQGGGGLGRLGGLGKLGGLEEDVLRLEARVAGAEGGGVCSRSGRGAPPPGAPGGRRGSTRGSYTSPASSHFR